ncbi:hypothetical protein NIES2104_08300 [Leptolyngbya sp. NIES-2104]|nr:hypothetical protein NIES2104_08300 [Leptolyngbya sp. NIES-2104]
MKLRFSPVAGIKGSDRLELLIKRALALMRFSPVAGIKGSDRQLFGNFLHDRHVFQSRCRD